MELGCDGVLVNTAIAKAKKPFDMALAFKNAVIAGRQSYLSGRIEKNLMGKPLHHLKVLFSFFKKFFFSKRFFFKFFLSFNSIILSSFFCCQDFLIFHNVQLIL